MCIKPFRTQERMTNDLLPKAVHDFLDNVEASLCLPILLIIICCTVYFIINHILDIICSVVSASDSSTDDGEPEVDEYNESPIRAKIRGMFSNMTCSLMPGESTTSPTPTALSSPIPIVKNKNPGKRPDQRDCNENCS